MLSNTRVISAWAPTRPPVRPPNIGIEPLNRSDTPVRLARCSYLDSRTKRALDLSITVPLLILLLPLLILTALTVKLTSRGPALFKQARHGSGQNSFELLKFRSMYLHDGGDSPKQAVRNDPRVTLVGRWIRRTSFDELPQLLNILRGDMSLVGPRPHAVPHDRYYQTVIENYADRWAARPGLTGYAQVNGARGETRKIEDMERRLAFDRYYIENASLRLDLRILFVTFREVMFSETAF